MSVQRVTLIKTELTRRGSGQSESDPVRIITEFWSEDGELVVEIDPFLEQKPAPASHWPRYNGSHRGTVFVFNYALQLRDPSTFSKDGRFPDLRLSVVALNKTEALAALARFHEHEGTISEVELVSQDACCIAG